MSLDKYNALFRAAYEIQNVNAYRSQQLMKEAQEVMAKIISTPTSGSSSTHYQHFSGSTAGTVPGSCGTFSGYSMNPVGSMNGYLIQSHYG